MRRTLAYLAAAALPFAAQAAVTASDAWVRGTVPAQKSTGAFVTLTSTDAAKLVAVSTSVAESAEIHSSAMHSGVMHMMAVDAVPLPKGARVVLKPGGFHIMLMGLTKPLAAGDQVPLTLTIEDAAGKRSQIQVRADVRPLGR